MRHKIIAMIESIYDAGTYWLDEAAHAVLYLLLAVTFPVWVVPYAIWKHLHGQFPLLSAGFLAFPVLA